MFFFFLFQLETALQRLQLTTQAYESLQNSAAEAQQAAEQQAAALREEIAQLRNKLGKECG